MADYLFTSSQIEDVLVFLRHCDFLGERASALSSELVPIVEEHLESLYSFFGESYPMDDYEW